MLTLEELEQILGSRSFHKSNCKNRTPDAKLNTSFPFFLRRKLFTRHMATGQTPSQPALQLRRSHMTQFWKWELYTRIGATPWKTAEGQMLLQLLPASWREKWTQYSCRLCSHLGVGDRRSHSLDPHGAVTSPCLPQQYRGNCCALGSLSWSRP